VTREPRRPPKNISEVLLSGRITERIEVLYALVVKDARGFEGIVRRDTPVGTMPFISDDELLIPRMLELARETPFRADELAVAVFKRVNAVREIRRGDTDPVPDPGPGRP